MTQVYEGHFPMMPVPYHQVVEFLDWLAQRHPDVSAGTFSELTLQDLAIRYLTEGRESLTNPIRSQNGSEPDPSQVLASVLRIFQACPMIDEAGISDQMNHFASCGRCLGYIQGQDPRRPDLKWVVLHPFLLEFVRFSEDRDISAWIKSCTSSLDWRGDSHNDEGAFAAFIDIIGCELRQAFDDYLDTERATALVCDYLENRQRLLRESRSGSELAGGLSLDGSDDVASSARRLAHSVMVLIESDYYSDQMARDPRVYAHLAMLGIASERAPQAIEFLSWLQGRHPKLDILASAPSDQIRELATLFCEEAGYRNAASFTRDVMGMLRGTGERGILQRLADIGARAKGRRLSPRAELSPFERYLTVPYHAMFLFLSAGDFPAFIKKYWEDLNYLTGDYLDVNYSYEDIERKVSGYQTLGEFRSIEMDRTALPAILLWKKSLSDRSIVQLEGLTHEQIFDVMKTVSEGAAQGKELNEICREASVLVREKTQELAPGTTIVNKKGKVIVSKKRDTYSVTGGSQVGVVGPNTQTGDLTLNQAARSPEPMDLLVLADELSRLRAAMKAEASDAAQDGAVGDVAKAEQAAKAKDGFRVSEHLKSAGQWALEIAEKIGVRLAADTISRAAGL